jgi:hypothetical protein
MQFFLDQGLLNLSQPSADEQILSLSHKGLLLSNKIIADLLP